VYGGAGSDTLGLDGDLEDFTTTENDDGTYTITNGSTSTRVSSIEQVVVGGGSPMSFSSFLNQTIGDGGGGGGGGGGGVSDLTTTAGETVNGNGAANTFNGTVFANGTDGTFQNGDTVNGIGGRDTL